MLAAKREQRDPRHESTSKRTSPTARQAAAKLWRKQKRSAAGSRSASRRARALLPEVLVLGLALGSYSAMVALMWLAFARTGEGEFVMLIATLVYATFIVVPLVILSLARRDSPAKPASVRDYFERTMDTLTGPLDSRAALVKIMVVPVLLTFCLVGIAIAVTLAR